MFSSTSLFNISGDRRLSKWQLRLYFLANRLNNSFSNLFLDKNLELKKFILSSAQLEKFWPEIEPGSSPSRALSNLFWLSLPWSKIKKDLGGAIHILDVGCGSGNYALKLQKWSGGQISSYLGLDTKDHPNWPEVQKLMPIAHFQTADSTDITKFISPKTNLFISQSAIEHFKQDLLYFRQIRKFIEVASRPVLQIHLFPSVACLLLYGAHGFRQYTPRTVSKITRLFSNLVPEHKPVRPLAERTTSILYALGGPACNRLHYNFITKPKLKGFPDLHLFNTLHYAHLLKESIAENTISKNTISPSFYALFISHLI